MKTIYFKIESTKNPQIYQEGYVEIPDDIEEPCEWYYYDQSGLTQPRPFIHHDGIGISQIGATNEQLHEIEEFSEEIYYSLVDWVEEVIIYSEETDKETMQKGNIKITIGDD